MVSEKIITSIKKKYDSLHSEMDERGRRLWAAVESNAIGRGGVAALSKATGLAKSTIVAGRKELKGESLKSSELRRVRKKGGGRKQLIEVGT